MTVDDDEDVAKGEVIAKDERRANNERSDTKWNLLPIETREGTSSSPTLRRRSRPTNFVLVLSTAAATSMQSRENKKQVTNGSRFDVQERVASSQSAYLPACVEQYDRKMSAVSG
ncbi:hypothetical protein K0M31_017660 [Melipona bicolor]|uniref:Uncharacterized protein n=1 Tax=Melipona bicolor TaxID=60889 RepID=A0AA40G5A6_9HYME|nr:hypothetical protein K0M31_017660 [Melipona bicolor]